MKMIKDNVVKEIPTNLVSQYGLMGWKEYKERPKVKETPKSNDNID